MTLSRKGHADQGGVERRTEVAKCAKAEGGGPGPREAEQGGRRRRKRGGGGERGEQVEGVAGEEQDEELVQDALIRADAEDQAGSIGSRGPRVGTTLLIDQ